MKNFTKKLLAVGALATIIIPFVGMAQQTAPPLPDNVNLSYGGIIGITNNVANILFGFLVAVSVFYILWAAWEYMQGEVDPAKGRLWNAAIALAIGLLAKILPKVIFALAGMGLGTSY